jgi:acylphosphatase
MVALECCLVRVEGRVQGVGFREACVDQARALQLAGWVRNRLDGSVEVLFQGPPDALTRMRAWLKRGPPAAHVLRVQSTPQPLPSPALAGFERRPTA